MKKITLSAALIAAMSTFAIAGGDIAPVEPIIEEPIVEESTGAFYLGLGYGFMDYSQTNTYSQLGDSVALITVEDKYDDDLGSIMLQAGYKFNDYVAIEGRYWIGLDSSINNTNADLSIDAWGIYVKPMYPVTEEFTIYGLLGYADNSPEVSSGVITVTPDYDLDGFSWGIGADYAFGENWSVFLDYVVLYDDTTEYISGEVEDELTTWNFGVTYTF